MRQFLFLLFVLASWAGSTSFLADPALAASAEPSSFHSTIIRSNAVGPAMQTQRFSLTYEAKFDVPALMRGEVVVWVPLPAEDDVQTVESYWMGGDLPPEKLLSLQIKRESEYGNRYVEAHVLDPAPGDKLSFRYTIVRREYSNPPAGLPLATALILPPAARFSRPDRLVPQDGAVAALAGETVGDVDLKTGAGRDNAIRAIYGKTLLLLSLDAATAVGGQGDVLATLKARRGDSIDFSSVVTGLARAAGIPAKFEAGVTIPNDRVEGELSGFQGWAYLYHPQRGWVPVSPGEGAQQDGVTKERRFTEYYLGRIGTDRVAFSTGRDLKLGQRGAPLNLFVAPYAEAWRDESFETVPMKLGLSFQKLPFP